jgi:acyl-homoserine-lactone acylase
MVEVILGATASAKSRNLSFMAGLFSRFSIILALAGLPCGPASAANETTRLKARASHITITRDDWGIAHVHGFSDADAVFGMAYAQADDDFNRVGTNYATNPGRSAEAKGEKAMWADLRQKLFLDPLFLKASYDKSPETPSGNLIIPRA